VSDIVGVDNSKIIELLLTGVNANEISSKLGCEHKMVIEVMRSASFIERSNELLASSLGSKALACLENINTIANDTEASQATRLKANQYIIDKAIDITAESGATSSPSTMTQDQLARRVKELDDELAKRAKPVDRDVVEGELVQLLE